MTMPFEDPIPPVGLSTPTMRRRQQAAIEGATQRAERRLELARLVSILPGSLTEKRAAIERAIKNRVVTTPWVPARSTIRLLDRMYRVEGKQSAADYRDDLSPRGPAPRDLPPILIAAVRRLAELHGTRDLAQLHYLARVEAEALHLPPLSPWHLRRVLASIGQPAIIAARHGSRAAQMDGFARSTYPTRHTHDLWLLDEADTRYRAKGFCRVREDWYAMRPPVILVRDHRSGAFVGYWVADPSRRIDKATGLCMTSGFDADDVLAALLSAAVPELAHPLLREYAGALPRKLRWDNASAHRALEGKLLQVAERFARDTGTDDPADDDDAETVGLPISRIPVGRPDLNGGAERGVGLVKRWIIGRPGHVDEMIPVDEIAPGEDLGRDRSLGATSTRGRAPRLDPVPVRALLEIDQLRDHIAETLARYNAEHHLRRNGMTPRAAAKKFMPPRHRRGDDLIRMMGVQSYTVHDGVQIARDGRSVDFMPLVNGVVLQRGAAVQVYVDPMLRRVWLDQGRRLLALKPKAEHAAEQAPADVARTMAREARAASDGAAQRRAEWIDEQAGPGTAAEGQQAYQEKRKQRRPRPGAQPPAVGGAPPTRPGHTRPNDDSAGFNFDPNSLMPDDPGEV